MQLVHKLDDFLYSLFPRVNKGDSDSLLEELQNFYSVGPFKPKITIDSDFVTIELDIQTIHSQYADYKKVVSLCDGGEFSKAKPILEKLIEKNPTVSEYHRLMGQIQSEEGNQDEAINYLIDALRWDSKNNWALLMMGNIFSKYKHDTETALLYYNQALAEKPDDYITITNIGAILLQTENSSEAESYLRKSLKINTEYPNTYFALGMLAEKQEQTVSAFGFYIDAIKLSGQADKRTSGQADKRKYNRILFIKMV